MGNFKGKGHNGNRLEKWRKSWDIAKYCLKKREEVRWGLKRHVFDHSMAGNSFRRIFNLVHS